MNQYPLNIRNAAQMRSVLGVAPWLFEQLASAFQNRIDLKSEQLFKDWMNGLIDRKPRKKTNHKLPTGILQAAFVLYFLKNYPLMQTLGERFDMDASTACKHLHPMLAVLQTILSEWGVLPQRSFATAQALEQYMQEQNWKEIFLDATERRHHRPGDNDLQRALYSGKKKCMA